MAGLGCGYFWGGRKAPTLAKPFRSYGVVEIGIGVWGLLSPWLVSLCGDWYSGAWAAGGAPSTILMLLVCAGSLFLPTFLMGATFPIALEGVRKHQGVARREVSLLYGLNSGGAALGAMAAGFLCIETLGLTTTCWMAAGINLLIGTVAFFLPGVSQEDGNSGNSDGEAAMGEPRPVAALALGLVSMGIQAIWIRLFAVILGSSVYSLSTVLAVFIVGIAVGSLALTHPRIARVASLGPTCLLLGGCLLFSGWTVDYLPLWFGTLRIWCGELGWDFGTYATVRFMGVAFILLPVTGFFGAALPLAVGKNSVSPKKAIQVFWVNTLGAVAGAGLTLPLFVPSLGLEGTYRIFLLLMVIIGGWESRGIWKARKWNYGSLIGIMAVLFFLAGSLSFDPYMLSAGAFRAKVLPQSTEAYVEKLKRSELLFYEDGQDASVAVLERGGDRVLKVNGKPDASTRGDMFTQVFSGHLPLLLHEQPDRTLVVGLGSGVTAHAASRYSPRVDVVELSGAVIRGSSYFEEVNHGVLSLPSVQIFQTDARGFLRGQESTYDVIISEPSNPWMAGNAGLFSVEFFQGVKRALKPNGLLAQWFHTYEMDDETLALVFHSLGREFPFVSVWEMFPNDLLMVASEHPLELDWSRMEGWLQNGGVKESLREGGFNSLAGLLSRQAMSPEGFRRLLETPHPVNQDDHPLLEYAAPRSMYRKGKATTLSLWSERIHAPGEGGLYLDRYVEERKALSQSEWEELFVLHTVYPGARKAYRESLLPQLLHHGRAPFLKDLLFTYMGEGDLVGKEEVLERLFELAPNEPYALHVIGAALLEASRLEIELDWSKESIESILKRCVQAGDEPKKRCAQLRARNGGTIE